MTRTASGLKRAARAKLKRRGSKPISVFRADADGQRDAAARLLGARAGMPLRILSASTSSRGPGARPAIRNSIPDRSTGATARRAYLISAERNHRPRDSGTAPVSLLVLRDAHDGLLLTLSLIPLACAVLEAQQADYDLEVATTLRNAVVPILSQHEQWISRLLETGKKQMEIAP